MNLDTLFTNYGGLIKTTKSTKKPNLSMEEILRNGIQTQRETELNTPKSWFKEGKVTPKVGVYPLVKMEDSSMGLEMTENQYEGFLNGLEESLNSGCTVLTQKLDIVREIHKKVVEQRQKTKIENEKNKEKDLETSNV